MGQLKPCKFCGADSKDIYHSARTAAYGARIACRNCGAETLDLPTDADAVRFWNNGYYTIQSHDERKILDACIQLMHGMVEDFKEYCDYMGWKPDPENEEERFVTSVSYREIVKRLFLWHTTHSGGTSSEAKCRELGIEDGGERVIFQFEGEDTEAEDGVGNPPV